MSMLEMKPSRRAAGLPVSPIRRLAPLAEAARARGTRVLHLNIGQPDLAPPATITQALAEAGGEALVYAPSRGLPDVLDAWQAYYRRHGIEVEAGDILVTFGASEAISLALLSTLDPGDDVLLPEPFYAPYKGSLAIAGCNLVPVPPGEGFAPPSFASSRCSVSSGRDAARARSPRSCTSA